MIEEVVSIKRKLTILEKILIILISFLSIPCGLAIGTFFVNEVNLFNSELFLIFLPGWLLSFFIIIFLEFFLKNVSIYKGFLQSNVISLFYSSLITFTCFFVYLLAGNYPLSLLIYAASSEIFYIVILGIARLILIYFDYKNKKYALIIGPKKDAYDLARKLIREDSKKYRVKYIFYEENGEVSDRIYEKFKECNVIVLLDSLSHSSKQKFLLYFNSTLNKDVYLCTTYFDIVLVSSYPTQINDLLSYEQKPLIIDFVEASIKRIIDVLISLILLILSLPVWLIIPLIIKISDKGPVFYKQVRLTKNQKEFNIIKFRSMKVDAEKDGAQLSTSNDARVTKIGKFIRATRIDEIPQVLNVLKGDMSFVGPRPERPEFVNSFLKENPLYKYRFNVKAGITGLQQVSTTYHTNYSDKLRYDLYYISNYSMIFDFLIMFKTIKTVLNKAMSQGVVENNLEFIDYLKSLDYEINIHHDYIRLIKKG